MTFNKYLPRWIFLLSNWGLLISILITTCCLTNAQTKVDSLLNELKTAKHDTTKIKVYNNLFLEYQFTDTSKAKKYVLLALKLSKKIISSPDDLSRTEGREALAKAGKKGAANSYIHLGSFNKDKGNYKKALKYYKKSLKIFEELGTSSDDLSRTEGREALAKSGRKGMSASYNNIGAIHQYQGNYPKALEYYQKSLKIKEELGGRKGMSSSYNNIGAIHYYQGNYPKALEYYQKSLKIREELGNRKGMSASYNNIGLIHNEQGNYPRALEYFQKSLKIKEELGDRKGMSYCYGNIGIIHKNQGNYPKALEYYQKSLKIFEKLGDRQGIAQILVNIAGLNIELKNYTKAIEQANKCLNIAKEIGFLLCERYAYEYLFTTYDSLRNYKKAYYYHQLYKQANDSLFNEESSEKLIEMETRYKTEKKEQEIEKQKILLEKKDAEVKQQEAVADRQRMQRNAFIGGFILVLLLSIIVFRSYRQQKKQKSVIALKNKNITDSINYAVRIQQAILPSEDFTNEILGEHFILFKPKDIVSGDFYWVAKIKNCLIIAAVDCSGHGVPGAFMSMLGVSFLNETVRKEEITQPNQVLNELRENIIRALKQKKEAHPLTPSKGRGDRDGKILSANWRKDLGGAVKDGMDMALIIINTENLKLQYAGANNPLYIVRRVSEHESEKVGSPQSRKDGISASLQSAVGNKEEVNLSGFGEPDSVSNEKHILYEVKADKMPIGIHEEMKEFTNNELQLQKGDTLYLFSDGYPDQFGGEKGKKFKYNPFKKLFLSIQAQSMEEQKAILNKTFEDWKDDLEQLDDVVVIGIKI